jgi:transcriptional regulator with XRE-family HTH domain
MMVECDFGRYLQRIRHLHGFTQGQLAEAAGLSSRCISDLERGINVAPRATTVTRLSRALELDSEARSQMILVAVCARDRLHECAGERLTGGSPLTTGSAAASHRRIVAETPAW